MIQIFVNNRELILPDDFSLNLIEENPEITNKGEYTLDITLSLLEPKNAIAFKFLNRINISDISKTADARIIVDGRIRNGMIVVLKNTDIDVTFQFLSGNSELNYIAKTEKKIWELDWGSEFAIDFTKAMLTINNPGYGEVSNFVCAPVKINGEKGALIYNNFKFIENVNIEDRNETVTSVENILMQPYLLYYINKLPELLGYTLKTNCLNNDDRAKIMYLINSVDSLNYADCLPDITVTEFIDAVEKFFNVSFVVDSFTKTISIVSYKDNYLSKKTVKIDMVLDAYSRELVDSEVTSRFGFSKIKYDLRDSIYFKYHELNDEILKLLTEVNLNTFSEINPYIFANNLQNVNNALYLFNIADSGDSYFYGTSTLNLYRKTSYTYNLNLINKFKAWGSGEKILELKIIPAEIEVSQMRLKFLNLNNNDVYLAYQTPKASNNYYVQYSQDFVEMVEETLKSVPRNNFLEVALFTGVIQMNNAWFWQEDYSFKYPFSHCDYLPEFGPTNEDYNIYPVFESWKNNVYSVFAIKSLRLNGTNGIVDDYQPDDILDISKEYTFTMVDGPDVRADNLFNIKNQMYMPISFERVKSNKKSPVKGYFYRMLD